MTYGGSKVRLLNCEYGARLSCPSLLRVDIQPIGRGITHAYTRRVNGQLRVNTHTSKELNFLVMQMNAYLERVMR